MLKDKMIKQEDPIKLLNVFQGLNAKENRILLWQSIQEKGRRICQNARIAQINIPMEEMTLYPHHGEFYFLNQSYMYFYGSNRTVIFKAPILYHSRLKLVLRLPKQIFHLNSRTEIREDVSLEDKNILLSHHSFSNRLFLTSKLIDISAGGLSFRSSFHNVERFKKGSRLWIRMTGDNNDLLEGEVCNVNKVTEAVTQQNYWRVGVKI